MFVAAVWTLGWFLLITAVAIAAIAALGVFLVGVFFIRVMAKNRGKSMDVRKIDNDTVRKAGKLCFAWFKRLGKWSAETPCRAAKL